MKTKFSLFNVKLCCLFSKSLYSNYNVEFKMFKFEKINSLFNCQLCNQFFEDPVTLPCGETVCKSHCDRISNDKCLFCSEIHITPKNGFLVNKVIKAQLEFQFNKINLNFTQFNDYKKILENLNKDLKEFETIHNDPCSYIYEYFSEITRQVDLRKEIVIKDIQTHFFRRSMN